MSIKNKNLKWLWVLIAVALVFAVAGWCIYNVVNYQNADGENVKDVTKAIKDIKAGKVEYRVDKTAIIHCPIGKKSFGAEKLAENYQALMDAIVKAKPASAKGTYLKSVTLASTMGPGVKVVPKI